MTTVNNRKVSPPSGKGEDQKEKGFFNRPRAGGKTMWDWLNLLGILAIPLVVAGATLLFGIQQAHLADLQHLSDQKLANQQYQVDQQNVVDQQRQATLVTFLDDMKDLLLNRGLFTSKPGDKVRVIARTETLTTMRQLDAKRNTYLVQFLQDAGLIGIDPNTVKALNIINLTNADMSDIDLSGANLIFVDLRGTHLRNANLSFADLSLANLIFADLTAADLRGTDLSGANLSGANLEEAKNLTQQQLDKVQSCKGVYNLPPGLTCHHN